MSDEPRRPTLPQDARDRKAPENGELEDLRRLLLDEERQKISRLDQELEKAKISSENIAPVLPDAIRRVTKDNSEQLTRSLAPTVQKAIHLSVKRDPTPLVNALFPVMGPAIRKSIAETFSAMLQSLNEALDKSFSVRGLKWRLEAWRSGKPFAEVVLLHSLIYRVEQIFLIHQPSGLLLQHAVAESLPAKNGDMVSGMLTAIQDFVRDSFAVRQGDQLDSLQVGDLTVWVEQAPHVALAAVIRGNPPQQYRQVLQELLERICRERGTKLAEFTGDTASFAGLEGPLQKGMRAQYKEKEKSSRKGFVVLGLILAALLLGIGYLVRQNLRWHDYLDRLQAEPGIVVIENHHRFGRFRITGLRDPLATDPASLLDVCNLKPENVAAVWRPFQSFEDEMLRRRIQAVLPPLTTVLFQVTEGNVVISGTAPHRWIEICRERLHALPGLLTFDIDSLVDQDLLRLQELKQRIEGTTLGFRVNSTDLLPDQVAKLDPLSSDLRDILEAAAALRQPLRLRILGRADSRGGERFNLQLSQRRAEAIQNLLAKKGVPSSAFLLSGLGAASPLDQEDTEEGRARNRSVVLEVQLPDATQ